jgi:Ca2+-binding RTX toxin-like protein
VTLLLGALVIPGAAAALGVDTIVGTGRADVIEGTEGADVMRGLAGRDTLRGRGGSDRLDGGPGGDKLFGDEGSDYLFAGAATSSLEELHGGDGDDVLVSVPNGIIRLVGGPGDDVLHGSSGISAFASDTFSGGAGNDKLLAVDITNTTDVFLPDACGKGRDLVELVRVPRAARADVVATFRTMYGCERIVFR